MATNIDLFEHPELLNPAKEMIRVLQLHACMVEDLENTKGKLAKKDRLDTHTLGKCRQFIEFVDTLNEHDNFIVELSKLSLNEIELVSICFSGRRLQSIHQDFRASRIQAYMRSQIIDTSRREEIHKRIKLYMKDGRFRDIYVKASAEQVLPKDHPPGTMAEITGSLEFAGAKWDNIETLFGQDVAIAIPKRDQPMTDGVRSTLSRTRASDDVLMSLEIASEPKWLSSLFPDGTARIDRIGSIFGPEIADAIDHSQLRQWEKRNGLGSQTGCVRLTYIIKLRLSSSLDIPNILY
ncbi:hypothetical protein LY76DRAFT_590569 [Colletotrichum caudatum]|nr:hypothetical protein LY76DRAFT_590569 [Colletotrichum caudatum]